MTCQISRSFISNRCFPSRQAYLFLGLHREWSGRVRRRSFHVSSLRGSDRDLALRHVRPVHGTSSNIDAEVRLARLRRLGVVHKRVAVLSGGGHKQARAQSAVQTIPQRSSQRAPPGFLLRIWFHHFPLSAGSRVICTATDCASLMTRADCDCTAAKRCLSKGCRPTVFYIMKAPPRPVVPRAARNGRSRRAGCRSRPKSARRAPAQWNGQLRGPSPNPPPWC